MGRQGEKMTEYEWITVQEQALRQSRMEREEAKENLVLGYEVDASVHTMRADIWEEIAGLLENVIHGTLLEE